MLHNALHARGLDVDVVWLYTPTALPLAESFTLTCLVYDCGRAAAAPVRDVIWLYGAAVAVAPAGLPFVRACEEVLPETAAARCSRNSQMLNTVSMHSWQRTAEAMDGLPQAALRQDHLQTAAAVAAQPRPASGANQDRGRCPPSRADAA